MISLVETPHPSPPKPLNNCKVEAEKRRARVVLASQRKEGMTGVKTNIHTRQSQSLVESGESKNSEIKEKWTLLWLLRFSISLKTSREQSPAQRRKKQVSS